jgi:hypothetical protein
MSYYQTRLFDREWIAQPVVTVVGQWAAPFLIMGIYSKMVKQHGSDARSRWAA